MTDNQRSRCRVNGRQDLRPSLNASGLSVDGRRPLSTVQSSLKRPLKSMKAAVRKLASGAIQPANNTGACRTAIRSCPRTFRANLSRTRSDGLRLGPPRSLCTVSQDQPRIATSARPVVRCGNGAKARTHSRSTGYLRTKYTEIGRGRSALRVDTLYPTLRDRAKDFERTNKVFINMHDGN